MTFKTITLQLTALFLLLLASCATTGSKDTNAVEYNPPGPEMSLSIDGDIESLCRDILGYDYPARAITYWADKGTTVWILLSKGKHGSIKSRFVVEDGKILNCSILASKEVRGRQIRTRRFLRQFEGLSLLKSSKLSKGVDGITGATISSKAVRDAARLALALDARVERD